jgi:hypothetical protein
MRPTQYRSRDGSLAVIARFSSLSRRAIAWSVSLEDR